MCGIAGLIRTSDPGCSCDAWPSRVLAHRGPDCSGVWHRDAGLYRISIGHWRLRILDLSDAGRQPMTRGTNFTVFNGEIYNFLELRRILEEDGFAFTSN